MPALYRVTMRYLNHHNANARTSAVVAADDAHAAKRAAEQALLGSGDCKDIRASTAELEPRAYMGVYFPTFPGSRS
ncbi:MAG: hypothetical protein ACXWHZ_03715 [Usitatibacter sp.]